MINPLVESSETGLKIPSISISIRVLAREFEFVMIIKEVPESVQFLNPESPPEAKQLGTYGN